MGGVGFESATFNLKVTDFTLVASGCWYHAIIALANNNGLLYGTVAARESAILRFEQQSRQSQTMQATITGTIQVTLIGAD